MAPRSDRRRSDEPMLFQSRELSHDYLPELWRTGSEHWWRTRERIAVAQGLRTKTMTVQLRESWRRRHPEASDWVIKVLPERRTLERDLIAAVADVEPTYSRVAVGKGIDRDFDHASQCENYMETWRRLYAPYQTSAEKCAEDGMHGGVVLPSDVDMDGCPDFYDRLDEQSYDALDEDDERRGQYIRDEDDPKGRYVRRNEDGSKKINPKYDKGDDEKSKEAHAEAVQRYLLTCDEFGVSVRIISANDCVPFLLKGTGRDRWIPFALLERTLYYPEELLQKGYGWRGMGDRLLIPQGFDATRTTGQNGMWYVYTLYTTWVDPKDSKKVKRPILAYSVGGNPTWTDDPTTEQQLPDNGVAVIDLYERYGLTGRLWWWGGGLHTSDDSFDLYWEPYLWPLAETIIGIEGKETATNAAIATGAFTGWYHKPDATLVGSDGVDDDALVDANGELRKPVIPEPGEIETVVGDVFPAMPTVVSPDAWRALQVEYESLRENTTLEHPGGAGGQTSGRSLSVKATIAQTAKRHIREGALDFVQFCGETAMRVLHAIEKEHDVRWPLQTDSERPVGAEMRIGSEVLEWNSDWVGDGEYRLKTDYPEEYNPVKVEMAMAAADRGYGSPEDVWAAQGKTDPNSEWTKVLKWKMKTSPEFILAQTQRYAKRQGDKMMLQVLKLQQQQKMTQTGVAGFPAGVPTSAVGAPDGGGPPGGAPSGGPGGGPNVAQRAYGGIKAAETGPQMQDAALSAEVGGSAP
jgi:hypothetical protein